MQEINHHMTLMNQQNQALAAQATSDNPLFQDWAEPFGVPPFGRVEPEHFLPAFERAFAAHAAEIAAIAADAAEPTFANTIDALETAGDALTRASNVFYLLAGAHTNDAILEVERELAPLAAKHWNRILMDESLFPRIDALYRRRAAARPHGGAGARAGALSRQVQRAGAALDAAAKARLGEINERLAALGTTFSQNVLADEQGYTMVLDGEDDLAGLPDFVRAAAAGRGRGARHCRQARHHRFALERRAVPAILVAARFAREGVPRLDRARRRRRRDRQQGDHCRDDGAARRARAAARLSDVRALPARRRHGEDAGGGARSLLEQRLGAGAPPRLADRDALQALVAEEGGNFALAPWDWRYYAEKLRKLRCDIEEAAIKPYFQLDRIIEAAFYTANRCSG